MIQSRPSQYPHVEWLDLQNNGIYVECAIMRKDNNGNIYFFEINHLDSIDKRRLLSIITNRNSNLYELWDLMSNITLKNGVNALTYFHQLVKVVSPSGQIYSPRSGVIGGRDVNTMMPKTGTFDTNAPTMTAPQQNPTEQQVDKPTNSRKRV